MKLIKKIIDRSQPLRILAKDYNDWVGPKYNSKFNKTKTNETKKKND